MYFTIRDICFPEMAYQGPRIFRIGISKIEIISIELIIPPHMIKIESYFVQQNYPSASRTRAAFQFLICTPAKFYIMRSARC